MDRPEQEKNAQFAEVEYLITVRASAKGFDLVFVQILMRLIILVCWAETISLRALCLKIPRERALTPLPCVSSPQTQFQWCGI